jgi:hypothetical protein
MDTETGARLLPHQPFKLTDEALSQLYLVFDYDSPLAYRDTLLQLYHTYILHHHKDLPDDFENTVMHMELLLEFLRKAEEGV